jgi:hypothetical protein
VRVEHLAIFVGENGRAGAVQDRRSPGPEARSTGGFHADESHRVVVDEPGEEPDGVRAPADARDDGVREPVVRLEHLLARLAADHCLQLSHDARVRRRPDTRADEVVRRLDVRDPVANRLARRLLQRLRAELDGPHLRTQQAHALDVRCCRRMSSAPM